MVPAAMKFKGACSVGKESACNVGDSGSIPGLGRSPGEGNSKPLQYSRLESSLDRGVWWAAVQGNEPGMSEQPALAPGKDSYENLDSVLKSRDVTLTTKVCILKAMVFPYTKT